MKPEEIWANVKMENKNVAQALEDITNSESWKDIHDKLNGLTMFESKIVMMVLTDMIVHEHMTAALMQEGFFETVVKSRGG